MKKNVGKKRCPGKILIPALISFVVFSSVGFYIPGQDTDFISIQEQEAADAEEELSTDEIVKQFYEWYGYLPDEDSGDEVYNFLSNTLHSDYNKDEYEDEYADSEDGNEDYYMGKASFLSSGLASVGDDSKKKPVKPDSKKDNSKTDSKPKVVVKTTVNGNRKTVVTTTTEVKTPPSLRRWPSA